MSEFTSEGIGVEGMRQTLKSAITEYKKGLAFVLSAEQHTSLAETIQNAMDAAEARNKGALTNHLKTLANQNGKPPINEHDPLFVLGEHIMDLLQKFAGR